MRVCESVRCADFPCENVRHESYVVPAIELCPEDVSVFLISEVAPQYPADHYYATGTPLFAQTTVQVFQDAGVPVSSLSDILALGVYLTTAVKCGKNRYTVPGEAIITCAGLLERELALFPNVKAILLMGDVAIRALNTVAKRAGEGRVVPAGATYKLRGGVYHFRGARVFPSYLQAGPSFFIEKGKHVCIAEDIAAALRWAREGC